MPIVSTTLPKNSALPFLAAGVHCLVEKPLAAAQARCVETLGVDHRPVPDSNKVTRAMVDCLRDAGWRGLGH